MKNRKEQIKSTLLIALVISSLVLTSQIWFNEKLWPDGYNFFVNMRASAFEKVSGFFGAQEASVEHGRARVLEPVTLAAYTVKDMDHVMTVINDSNDSFELINDYISSTITLALTMDAKKITRVSESDWQKALFTRGLYVDYGVSYNTATFSQLLGVTQTPFADYAGEVQQFIIMSEDSIISTVSVYTMDEVTQEYYKISTGLNKEELYTNLSILAGEASPLKRFSFMINLNAPTSMAGEAVFAPYLILNEEKAQYPALQAINPVFREDEPSMNAFMIEKLLKAFSINSKTVQKYTDADENIIFVRSQATLKITTDGVLSYTTVSGGKGLSLSGAGAQASSADILSLAAKLPEGVLNAVSGGEGTQMYLSGFEERPGGNYTVQFDYRHNGIPIHLSGPYEGQHAVQMEIEGGLLKSYTQVLRSYEQAETNTEVESTYRAVDLIYEKIENPEMRQNTIDNIFVAYDDDGGNGEKRVTWFLTQRGVSQVYKK